MVPHYHDNATTHFHLHLHFIHIRRPDVAPCCLESLTPLRSRGYLLIPVNAKCPSIPHQNSGLLHLFLNSAPDRCQWTVSGRRHPLHSGVFCPCWHSNPGIKCLKLKGRKWQKTGENSYGETSMVCAAHRIIMAMKLTGIEWVGNVAHMG